MKPACYMPWHAVAVTASGKLKPCCQWRGSAGDFGVDNMQESLTALTDVRASLLQGELPKSCGSCSERERMVGTSRRFWFDEKFTVPSGTRSVNDPVELIQADINLSNVCNLKCRMCGSWASNSWFKEDRILAQRDPRYQKDYSADIQTVRQTELSDLQELLSHSHTLQRIDFKGGEPMMAKNHVEFLNELVRRGGENIVLQYTTNGTVVNPGILDALSQFKQVRIMFSIEGTGKLYEYIRGGSYTFEQLEKTLDRYASLNTVQIGFNVTIQAYNLLNLKELYLRLFEFDTEYTNVSAKSAFTTVCNSPIYLSPFVLPAQLREQSVQQLESISDFSTLCKQLSSDEIHKKHWDTFVNFTRDLDELRNENILSVVPELKDYIDK